MPQSDKNNLTIIFSTLILFVALFVLIFFLIPRINRLKAISNDAAKKQAEYESGLVRVASAQKAVEAIGQARSESQLLGVAIPDSSQADEALLQLSSLASSSSLKVISAEVVSSNEGILRISFSTRGSFENTAGFISKLKNNLRPNKIVELNMTRVGDEEINANFSLEFPYLYQSTQSPATKQTAID